MATKGSGANDDSSPGVTATTQEFSVLGLSGEESARRGETEDTVSADAAPVASGGAGGSGGAQGRRAKAGSGPKIVGARIGGDSYTGRVKDPAWLKDRVAVYEKVKERRQAELANKKPVEITVTLPDGKVIDKDKDGNPLQTWKSTPFDVARVISQGLADAVTVARVTYSSLAEDYSLQEDGMEVEDTMSDAMADAGLDRKEGDAAKAMLWDMSRPLVGSVAKLELLKFETDQDAKTVFWHSSAHMMGEALEHLYGSKLTIGPPLAGGFYYDSYMGPETLKEEDCKCCHGTNPILENGC